MTNQDGPNTAAGAAEPVAWMYEAADGERKFEFNPNGESARWLLENGYTETPLYTRPPENPSQRPSVDDEEEAYKLGKEDGYSEAVQWIDERTGGDGEYFASTIPGHGCPGPVEMRERIVERFNALSRPSVVPDEVVEIVALSVAQYLYEPGFEPLADPETRDFCENVARAAITAAIPAIKAQVLAEIVAYLRMGEHVHSRSGSLESERVFKLIADAIERGEHENE